MTFSTNASRGRLTQRKAPPSQEIAPGGERSRLAADEGLVPRWECQESCVRGLLSHHALTNLSSNMMANWVLASHHSRGGIFHVCATWRKTRYSNLIAASSVGKCPLVRTARRSLAFKDSMAFVTGMREPAPKTRLRATSLRRMVRPSGTEAPGARRCGQADLFHEP